MRRFFACLALCLMPAASSAQEFLGKTAVYTWLGTSNQIYVAPSGNVYWSIQTVDRGKLFGVGQGAEYKLGRTIKTSKKGCTSTTTARGSGSSLVLDIHAICGQFMTTAHNVITFSGGSCHMTGSGTSHSAEYGDTSYSEAASSCQVMAGNKLAQ
jgi:hypothetical protein